MSREIEYFDGTSWTTTKVAPTRNAPFAGLGRLMVPGCIPTPPELLAASEARYLREQGRPVNMSKLLQKYRARAVEMNGLNMADARWTTTRVAPTRNAPFAGLRAVQPTPSKGKGVLLGYKMMGNRAATADEITAVVKPFVEAHRLKIVGKPEYAVDPSPVWVWQSEPNEYGGGSTWTAVVGTGTFKGAIGAVQSGYTPPTQADTLKLPQAIGSWVVELEPVSLEDPEALRAQLAADSRDPKFKSTLQNVMGDPLGVSPMEMRSKVIELKKGGGKALASAALIGIALTMFSLREKF